MLDKVLNLALTPHVKRLMTNLAGVTLLLTWIGLIVFFILLAAYAYGASLTY